MASVPTLSIIESGPDGTQRLPFNIEAEKALLGALLVENRLLEEIGREVAASAGAACHAGSVAVSHVLDAMRVPIEWARGALRFSLGRMTTPADIDRAVDAVTLAVTGLRNGTK